MTDVTYQTLENLIKALECSGCRGVGKQSDYGLGDIHYNEWTCQQCQGTGIDGDIQQLKDHLEAMEHHPMTDHKQNITIDITGDSHSGKTQVAKIIKQALDNYGISVTVNSNENSYLEYEQFKQSNLNAACRKISQTTHVTVQDYNHHNLTALSAGGRSEKGIDTLRAQPSTDGQTVGDIREADGKLFCWTGDKWFYLPHKTIEEAMDRLSDVMVEDSEYAFGRQANKWSKKNDSEIKNQAIWEDSAKANQDIGTTLTSEFFVEHGLFPLKVFQVTDMKDSNGDICKVLTTEEVPVDDAVPLLDPQLVYLKQHPDMFPLTEQKSYGLSPIKGYSQVPIKRYTVDIPVSMYPYALDEVYVVGIHSVLARVGGKEVRLLVPNGEIRQIDVANESYFVTKLNKINKDCSVGFSYDNGTGLLSAYVENFGKSIELLGVCLYGDTK